MNNEQRNIPFSNRKKGGDLGNITSKVNDLDAQMAEKLSQGQVSVTDIDKNKGKFDQTYMTDEFLQQMAGTTPINSVPADKSITLKKTTFFKLGKNLFNKNVVTIDYYVSNTTGQLVADTLFTVSEHILIETNTTYVKTSSHSFAFYDADGIFISGGTGSTFTTPSNAVTVRISTTKSSLDSQQLEKGSVATFYEPYIELIEKKYIETPDVDPKNLKFSVDSSNLFNKNDIKQDFYISSSTGSETSGTGFVASNFIPIESNFEYIAKEVWHCAFYDVNKVFISGKNVTSSERLNHIIKSPSNAAFVRFSFYPPGSNAITVDIQQLNKGNKLLPYNAYGKIIPKQYIEPLTTIDIVEDLINIPSKIYALNGYTTEIYFENVMPDKQKNISVDGTRGRYYSDRYSYSHTSNEDATLTIEIFDKARKVSEKKATISNKTVDQVTANFKAVLIGDSTTAGSDGLYPKTLVDLFNADTYSDIELIGTKGVAPNVHEGRPGWNTTHYLTQSSDNAFFNPSTSTFDFSYYMTSNGFSGLTHAFLHLGINDIFGVYGDANILSNTTQVLNNFDTMINSIRAYDPNIKVGILITIPPNASQDSFGEAYGLADRWGYKRHYDYFVSELIKKYDSRTTEGIYLIPTNVILDTKTEIRDAVHPVDAGYVKMGETVYKFLKVVG